MEYHSAITKNEIILFRATWMDTDITILSEIKQTEKDKYHMISLMCGIKKKIYLAYLQSRKRLTDIGNKLWLPKGKGQGGKIRRLRLTYPRYYI